MKLGTWVLAVMALFGIIGRAAATTVRLAQDDGLTPLTRAWVDPAHGSDSGPSGGQVNNPNFPYKTIQKAIDDVQLSLRAQYSSPNNTNVRGLVYCLPGLYGPHTQTTPSSGDTFPIYMRDRVNLQGLGSDTCIIRGDSTATPPQVPIFWPDPSLCPPPPAPGLCAHDPRQVLIDFRDSGQFNVSFPPPPSTPMPPWAGEGDYSESIDGFTFQGGDVQVLFQTYYQNTTFAEPLSGKLTNCIFDMRHDWTAYVQGSGGAVTEQVHGPYFGVMMSKAYMGQQNNGYFDQTVLVANNTFVLAEWNFGGTWTNSRDSAVGIIDVTDVGCANAPFSCQNAIGVDPNPSLRGVGNPGIMNNIFRTWPNDQQPGIGMAMLGIDAQDTLLIIGSGSGQDTNAFAPGRVGTSNQPFSSVPRFSYTVGTVMSGGFLIGTLVNDNAADTALVPLPAPKVTLWTGTSPVPAGEIEPGFVGEFGKVIFGQVNTTSRDWRLMPSSPLQDAGLFDKATGVNAFANGTSFSEPSDSELRSFDWDGEGYGNSRVAGPAIDIGADEVHLMVMTWAYAPDSRSFSSTGFLNPSAVSAGDRRVMILPSPIGLNAQSLTVHGAYSIPTLPVPLPGWVQPPATLTPATFVPLAGVLREYRMQYISFLNNQNPPPPTPWTILPNSTPYPLQKFTQFQNWVNISLNKFDFYVTSADDPEGATGIVGPNTYFNTQAVITWDAAPDWWSNLQFEYR
jgi:hypothetical protein